MDVLQDTCSVSTTVQHMHRRADLSVYLHAGLYCILLVSR